MDFPPHHAQSNAVGQNKVITKTTHSDRTKTCHKITPSGVVLVLREASQLGTEKVPTLPSVIQSVSKQLKEILQLYPHDSSGTVWAEVVRT